MYSPKSATIPTSIRLLYRKNLEVIMDEQLFKRDWELSQSITNLARTYLEQDLSIDETMNRVLDSPEYKEWCSETRTFGIACEERFYYEDLHGSIQFEKYEALIQLYSHQYFSEMETEKPQTSIEYDHIFEQLGMKVTVQQLGYEIAQLSKLIGAKSTLNYQALLSLFNGTVITSLEEDLLDCLFANEEAASQFIEDFFETYKTDSSGESQ